MNKNIAELNLYDLAPFTKGVAKDLSHCNTPAQARAPSPARRLQRATRIPNPKP